MQELYKAIREVADNNGGEAKFDLEGIQVLVITKCANYSVCATEFPDPVMVTGTTESLGLFSGVCPDCSGSIELEKD